MNPTHQSKKLKTEEKRNPTLKQLEADPQKYNPLNLPLCKCELNTVLANCCVCNTQFRTKTNSNIHASSFCDVHKTACTPIDPSTYIVVSEEDEDDDNGAGLRMSPPPIACHNCTSIGYTIVIEYVPHPYTKDHLIPAHIIKFNGVNVCTCDKKGVDIELSCFNTPCKNKVKRTLWNKKNIQPHCLQHRYHPESTSFNDQKLCSTCLGNGFEISLEKEGHSHYAILSNKGDEVKKMLVY